MQGVEKAWNSGAEQNLMLDALRGVRGSRPPVWLMRQAGRYLPEYRELRRGRSMLESIRDVDVAVEITLQPMRRYSPDAAIIFADILNPLIGMGIELEFVEKEGPVIRNPVRDRAAVEALRIPDPEENVGYTLNALRRLRRELSPDIALLGFSGAPFTLSSYLIEGGGSSQALRTKQMMFREPALWNALQDKLSRMISEYLVAKVRAGADAVQIFDSWAGLLGPEEFRTFALPWLKQIVVEVKRQVSAPVIFFATGATGLFPLYREIGADAFGVDWRVSLSEAARLIGVSCPLQGNLDPVLMCGSADSLVSSTRRIIDEGRTLPAHIMNVGHGLTPESDPELVRLFFDTVRSYG